LSPEIAPCSDSGCVSSAVSSAAVLDITCVNDSNNNCLIADVITKCVLINARSLQSKLHEFQHLIAQNYAAIFITESWLNETVTTSLLDGTHSFNIYRKDRLHKRGGGVIGMISKQFHSYHVPLPAKFDLLEVVCFCVLTALGTFRFITVYRPPEYNQEAREYMRLLNECLEFLCNTSDTVVLVGDFNLPRINWNIPDSPDDRIHSLFLDLCVRFGLHQFVDVPTHDNNCLDLILSTDPLIVSDLSVSSPFSSSDHCMVNFNVVLTPHESTELPRSNEFGNVYDLEKADFVSMNVELMCHPFNSGIVVSNSAENISFADSVDEVWSKFVAPLNAAINNNVPLLPKVRNKSNNSRPKRKYYPRHICRAIKRKEMLWKKYKNDPSLSNKCNYKNQVVLCKKLTLDYERSKELAIINKANVGSLYRFINKKLTSKSGVGPLRLDTGQIITDDVKKASVLNDYFASVFTKDDGFIPTFNRRVSENVSLKLIEFTPDVVYKAIKSCKNNKTPDPGGYNTFLLKQLAFSLVNPLCVLFKHVFEAGVLPAAWKSANVTPVFKKGASSSITNYRPISLTSVFCKLFERIVKEQMLKFLLDNKLITPHQHGFMSMHSTSSQLLETVNDWTLSVKNRHVVDAIYFDYAKAFDSVSHVKLVHKLRGYGIDGQLLSVIVNFLSNRTQRVLLPAGASSSLPVTSGVPQGSVLGPLLFLLYINDVSDLFTNNTKIKLYADDIKIYLEICCDSDTAELQRDINRLSDWSKMWQLSLSIGKCFHIRVGLNDKTNLPVYNVCNATINSVSELRDLGVMVDEKLNFSSHVKAIACRAHLRANQILRFFISKDRKLLTMAFTTYVRPIIEYCSSIWNPHQITLINKLESVQRYFTKRLFGVYSSTSYDDRCLKLGLKRLELRRLHCDLIYAYKIIHGFTCLPASDFFIMSTVKRTRGHTIKLALPVSRIDCRKYFFSVRIVKVWNSLPDKLVTAKSVHIFKSLLVNQNLNKFIVGKK